MIKGHTLSTFPISVLANYVEHMPRHVHPSSLWARRNTQYLCGVPHEVLQRKYQRLYLPAFWGLSFPTILPFGADDICNMEENYLVSSFQLLCRFFFWLANQLDDCSNVSLLKYLIETISSVKIEIRYMNLPYLVQIVLKHTVHMQKRYANWINNNLRMKEAWDSNYSRQYLCCNIYSNFIKHLQDQIDHDENPQKIIQIWNCRENSTHFSSGQPKQTRHGSY